MANNNKANVSTTRGVKGGYFFSAPLGTTDVPTKANFTSWSPTSAWENQGYIPEDGFTETVSTDGGGELRDLNLDTVDYMDGSHTESVQVAFMEMAKNALSTQYGHSNVTDEDGVIEVQHNWAQAEEHRMYAFLLLLKNGRKWVKYIPDGKVTELGDFTGNKTTAAQRQATITYIVDDDGVGCFDWIESTETPAPQLTALSGTGITLSPTFAAGTRTYTATSSAGSTTITATAGTGKTVAIKDGNGNSYSSGGSVPLVTGKNVLTITVTDTSTGAKGIYTLTITKS